MRTIQSLLRRLRSLLASDSNNAELSEELQFHLDRETEQNIADGMSPEDARSAARANFGSISQVAEECYRSRGTAWIEDLTQDVCYGFRTMMKHRSFSVATVLTLSLGIGACTAIFSLVSAVLLRSLPYGNPERMVYIFTPSPQLLDLGIPVEVFNPSFGDFLDLKNQSHSFEAMTLFQQTTFNFSSGDQIDRVGAAKVDTDFFRTLQSNPQLGRVFNSSDEKPGSDRVVLISHELWKNTFQEQRTVLGRTVRLDGADYQIVGVMPADFEYPHSSDLAVGFGNIDKTQLWVPFARTPQQLTCREGCGAFAVGRLKPGVTISQAQMELGVIMTQLDSLHSPGIRNFTSILRPFREVALGPVKPLLTLLCAAVGLLFLIACANAASLLLAQAATRTHELGVRTTLGAKRGRLLRQMLTESLLLAITAGCAGIALAWLFLRLLLQLDPGDIPRMANAALDSRVLCFLAAITALTCLLFGVLPSIITTRINLSVFLKSGGTRGIVGDKRWMRKALVVGQIALVMVLLTGAGLMLRSYAKVLAVPTGFSPSTTAASIQFSPQLASVTANPRYDTPEKRRLFFTELLEKLNHTPGVEAVGLIDFLPLSHSESMTDFEAEGYPNGKNQMAEVRRVTPRYFSAMEIPQVQGRDFNDEDGPEHPEVVVVNDALAKRYFVNGDAMGKHVRMSKRGPWLAIVGVIGDVRNIGPETASGLPGKFCTRWDETNWYRRSMEWRSRGSTHLSRL